MKRLSGTIVRWPAFVAVIALSGCLVVPRALAQTQTQALADAQAALAQAQADAKKQIDCQSFSGIARTICNHGAAAQVSAHNKRVADAQALVVKLQTEANQQTADGAQAGRQIGFDANQQVAQAVNSQGNSDPRGISTGGQVSAPAPGLNRYAIAKGGLFVDVPGSYPQGYAPAWVLNGTTPQPVITNRYNLLNHGPQGTETLFVRIVDDQGRAALEFSRRSTQACLADIVGLPQVITSTPQQFGLANFRYANNQGPQCQRSVGSTAPWKGTITLSANADGDLALSLVLDLAMASGAPWFEFTAQNLPFPNRMTPQMAAADMETKSQAAAASVARAQAAASAAQAATAARAAEAARIAALPSAGPVYSRQMAGYVQADARGWAMNQLDAASVHNVRIYSGSVKAGNFILRAEYTYNGGAPGWVVAQYSAGKFSCIQFWDSMIGCRQLREAGQGQKMLQSIIVEGMSSGGSGSSNDCSKSPYDFDADGHPVYMCK